MIIAFQHHVVPHELAKETDGGNVSLRFDANGAPRMTANAVLADLDQHIAMMDFSGIDAAFLTCPPAMCADLDLSRLANERARKAEADYPGRFIGGAHVNPLGGQDALRELDRCAVEFGFQGAVITSEIDGVFIDDPKLDPFWERLCQRDMFVFVHPALTPAGASALNAYDMGRSIGREFSLIAATIRLIDSGLLDRFPTLRIQMSHFGGGIATMLGRIRKFQDRAFFGTANHPVHGKLPQHDLDYYLNERLVFDTAGVCGAITSVSSSLTELNPARIVFGTDYPQEIRTNEDVKTFVDALRALGATGTQILSANNGLLLRDGASTAPRTAGQDARLA
jgi:predicted TIM-barrel fold metal-dependent hydrolase